MIKPIHISVCDHFGLSVRSAGCCNCCTYEQTGAPVFLSTPVASANKASHLSVQVTWSTAANTYSSCSDDGNIKVWDAVSTQCISTLRLAHQGLPVTSVKFSRNGKVSQEHMRMRMIGTSGGQGDEACFCLCDVIGCVDVILLGILSYQIPIVSTVISSCSRNR